MSLYRLLKVARNKFKNGNINDVNYKIDQYLNQFHQEYRSILDVKSHVTNVKTLCIYSISETIYANSLESIIAKKIQMDFGWKVIFLGSLANINVLKKVNGELFGFKHFELIEEFVPINISGAKGIFSKLRVDMDTKEIENITYKKIPIGIHCLATLSASFPTGKVEVTDVSIKLLKKIIRTSMRYVDAMELFLLKVRPDLVIGNEKGIVTTCEIFYQCLNRNIKYIQYLNCHEPNSIMIKRYNFENLRMHPFSVSINTWRTTIYKDQMRDEVLSEFEEGYQVGKWFAYKNLNSEKKIVSREELIEILELDSSKKNAIIFSHILNDANFFYGKDIFAGGFKEWFVKTVEVASENRHVNWMVKLHPANIFRRANQGYEGEFGEVLAIKEYIGEIPENIKILPADIDINPYSFFMLADYGITVRGTVGAELPCFGIPVLTAGTGRYSGKGFTIDSDSAEEYLKKISNIQDIPRLSEEQTKLAIKHAYLFFKDRPAVYDSFVKDSYPSREINALKRSVGNVSKDIWSNKVLKNIASFMITSTDEDFLMSKNYA